MKRWDIIQALIDKYELKSYLEIGVHQKENFNKIRCDIKYCVDPNFPADFEMTSDEFFKQNEREYNLIFIDGMHTAEQTYRDLQHSIYCLSEDGFIVVHDCNPLTAWHTRPFEEYKRGEEWNGTTYKGFIDFCNSFPVNYITVDDDYGCGIIVSRDFEPEITWDHFDANRERLLNLVDTETFKKLLL